MNNGLAIACMQCMSMYIGGYAGYAYTCGIRTYKRVLFIPQWYILACL